MEPDAHALVGAYVLDALDDLERVSFERHLDGCPACAEETAELRETAVRLADLTAVDPPAELRGRVLARAHGVPQLPAGVPQLPARPERRGRPRPRWSQWAAAAVAVLIVAAGVGVIVGQGQRLTAARRATQQEAAQADRLAAVLAAPDVRLRTAAVSTGRVTVAVSDSRHEGVAVVRGLAAPGAGLTYQLWLVTASGPVSVGVVGADGTRLLPDIGTAATVGLTKEPAGGSRTPTLPLLVDVPLR